MEKRMDALIIPEGSMHALAKIEVIKMTEKEEIKAQIAIATIAFKAKGGTTELVAQGVSGAINQMYNGKGVQLNLKSKAAARGRQSALLMSGRKGPGHWT